LALCLAVISAVNCMPKAGIAAEKKMIISDYYYKNSYGRGVGTIPKIKKSINGGVGHAPVALNKDRGPGVMPKYDSYGRGVGTPGIDEQKVRTKKGNVRGSCSGDYPKHVGAKCFRSETCSDRKGDGKSWGYDFDGIATCWRKKETFSKAPKQYPAPSRAEALGCPSGTQIISGGCFENCPSGWKDQMVRGQPGCEGPKHGSCPSGKNKSGALCYPECRAGYHPDGLFCYADNKELCGSDRILEDGLCYKRCPDGYKGHATMCTQVKADQCASTEEMDAGLCYKKCSLRSAKYPNRTGARCYQTGATCKKSEENDNGLCYTRCRDGYAAEGPVCWGKTPKGYMQCGPGFARNKFTCGFVSADQVIAAGQLALAIKAQLEATRAARIAKLAAKAKAARKLHLLEIETVAELRKMGLTTTDALKNMNKYYAKNLKEMSELPDIVKAGKPAQDQKTVKALYRFWNAASGTAIRKLLWKVAGVGAYGASKSRSEEPPPFPTDPITIIRSSAEIYSALYAFVDLVSAATKAEETQKIIQKLAPTAVVTDILAGYMWPVYGSKQ
jgi:hypothetical protein